MNVTVNIQRIAKAAAHNHYGKGAFADFDTVDVISEGGRVAMFLPAGTGQAVADAINAAIAPAMVEAAE